VQYREVGRLEILLFQGSITAGGHLLTRCRGSIPQKMLRIRSWIVPLSHWGGIFRVLRYVSPYLTPRFCQSFLLRLATNSGFNYVEWSAVSQKQPSLISMFIASTCTALPKFYWCVRQKHLYYAWDLKFVSAQCCARQMQATQPHFAPNWTIQEAHAQGSQSMVESSSRNPMLERRAAEDLRERQTDSKPIVKSALELLCSVQK